MLLGLVVHERSTISCCCNNSADVVVELEESVYSVSEGDSMKQVCAVINTSRLESPVGFNFNVTVSLDGADGGIYILQKLITEL